MALKALHVVPCTPPSEIVAPSSSLRSRPAAISSERPIQPRLSNESPHSGLSNAELIAVIGTYRGKLDGLAGLNNKALLALLQLHLVSAYIDNKY